jgi:hypothetical protein
MSVGNLFRPIAAEPHAAPSTRAASRVIGKHQRAIGSLACLHVGEVFLGEHLRQCFTNREEERFRRSPASCTFKAKRGELPVLMRHKLSEAFVPGKESIQRLEIGESGGPPPRPTPARS